MTGDRPEYAEVAAAQTARARIRAEHPELVKLLDFEQGHRASPLKDSQIRDELRLSAARYYQLLNRVLDEHREAALEYSPHLVNRLLEERDFKRRARAARYQPNTKGHTNG